MSGHNKWSKVKHIKARVDAKKGKVFSKMAHEITIAARDGGGDPSSNARLRQAIDSAKSVSMPKDNIDRAVKKGTGELEGGQIDEVIYEGFGPSGTALIVQVATDNKNRSAAEIRSTFNKNNGNMGTSGSVNYLFNRLGEIRIDEAAVSEDDLLEAALEAGAEDVSLEDDEHIVITPPDQLAEVANQLRDGGLNLKTQDLVFLPITPVEITEQPVATQAVRLFEALDDYEDTLNVFSNFELSDEVIEAMDAES